MKIELQLLRAALCAGILLSAPLAALCQPEPPLVDDQAQRLEEALERYRDIERSGGWGTIPTTPALGAPYSYDCSLIAKIEKRLITEGYLHERSAPPPPPPGPPGKPPLPLPAVPWPGGYCPYGAALTDAMRAFQHDRFVLGDGQLGALTRVELNKPVGDLVDLLEHDVERWRHVAVSPAGTYLLVNIPFFELSVFERGQEAMRMPVVVGQTTWQTPQFSDQVEYLVLNPDWGIPEKIAKAEYWPQGHRDLAWLRYKGITADGGSLRQKPGPRNPLGRIKFVMPNPDDVYLHDTPEKGAFAAAVRALSHGCVRLSRPLDLANYLLRDEPEWDPRHLESAIATGQTRHINLRTPMPVHILYSTSRVNEAGRVEFRRDVYAKNGPRRSEEVPLVRPGDEQLDTDTGP